MSHKENLTPHKLRILKRLAEYTKKTGNQVVPLNILNDNVSDYANAQKLRYHALITKAKDGKKGTWIITAHGWAFLRGDKDLPKYVYVQGNKIQGKSSELVNVRDLNRGQVVVHNQFEYYNTEKEYLATLPGGDMQMSLV